MHDNYMYILLVTDIDECYDELAECKDGTYCDNTPGNYECKGEITCICDLHIHL